MLFVLGMFFSSPEQDTICIAIGHFVFECCALQNTSGNPWMKLHIPSVPSGTNIDVTTQIIPRNYLLYIYISIQGHSTLISVYFEAIVAGSIVLDSRRFALSVYPRTCANCPNF